MNMRNPTASPCPPWLVAASLAAALTGAAGCISHRLDAPIEIKPIHITMDINLRVQRELDEFFDFEDQPAKADEATSQSPGKE
jgi:hypothetical protein